LEHTAGHLPTWLSPVQLQILNVTDRQSEYCQGLLEELKGLGLRAHYDARNEKLGFKIREAQLQKIPYMLIIGDKEVENKKTKRVNFGPINIKNMTLDFEDKNLPIPFKTTISKLTGEVSAVKNRANSTSNLEINGVVDNYGVAKITGIVNPNDIKLLTDVNMKFKNISMKNFTPYTAKFVGRAIKDGKLELDLNYNISESNLKAKNSIIIKKLELGEKIESKDAVSLPLDLAITLLEDSSNTIDLNLPVSGNVDDPEFSIAAIVWKAFVNLITKAITAPFSLIGSLFNFSEDEIRFLRALQELADDEIIFCRRFWELYSQGKLETSHNEGESEEARKARDMQIIATEKNIYLLGTTNYFHKVEALKRFGIFGDVQHGLMGTTGGYGCALIIEQTGKFAEYVSLAEGLK